MDNTTHIYYAHLFIVSVLGTYYYKKVCSKNNILHEKKEDSEYNEIKREIDLLKNRVNRLEEEGYIM